MFRIAHNHPVLSHGLIDRFSFNKTTQLLCLGKPLLWAHYLVGFLMMVTLDLDLLSNGHVPR